MLQQIAQLIFDNIYKVIFLCDIKLVKNVLKVVKDVHPYEEPCIDIIPLLDENDF